MILRNIFVKRTKPATYSRGLCLKYGSYFSRAPLGTSSVKVAITGLPSSPTEAAARHQAIEGRILIAVVADVNVARDGDQEVPLAQTICGHAEARVADQLAEEQHAVGLLDGFAQRRRRHHPEVGPDKLRMQRRKHAATEERRRHRHVPSLGQLDDLIAQLKAVDFDADDQHRPLGGVEPFDDFGDRLVHRVRIVGQPLDARSQRAPSMSAITMSRGISR